LSDPLLELRGVAFGYAGRSVLAGADLALRAGDRIALVGPNGAGKSTLLHLLVGLHRPSAGEVIAFGSARRLEADFREVRARVGLLFQEADDQLFCPTVLEDVAFGPLNLGRSPSEARADAEQTLAVLGLDGFAERVTHRLSTGERRLVALATVLAMHPQVLLLDEPTSGLDEATEARMTEHLAGLPQAMVIVSHDRTFLGRLANRALLLSSGRLFEAALHNHPHTHTHSHLHVHALATLAQEHAADLPAHRHGHEENNNGVDAGEGPAPVG
jgi:cobalt/nickel transport system ATP-binding protein